MADFRLRSARLRTQGAMVKGTTPSATGSSPPPVTPPPPPPVTPPPIDVTFPVGPDTPLPPPEWTVYARDATYARTAEVDAYTALTWKIRTNDVGTWSIDVPADSQAVPALLVPGAGLVLVRDGNVIDAGPINGMRRTRKALQSSYTFTGFSDNVFLQSRLARPQPLTPAPPYNAQGYDTQTGPAAVVLAHYVDVNLGPSALGYRHHPGVTIPTVSPVGANIVAQARWDNLLTLLQGLATAGGVTFRLRQHSTLPELDFTVTVPADRSGAAQFSTELGNLIDFDYSITAGTANYEVVGGGGQDVARMIYEVGDTEAIARWWLIERFRDRRDTIDPVALAQTGAEELASNADKSTLAITPVDTPGLAYLTHYDVGDRVTVIIDGEPIVNVIQEVTITLKRLANRVTMGIATPDAVETLRIYQLLHRHERRMSHLERV